MAAQLFSDVGGILGLWAGISLIALAELILFIGDLARMNLYTGKKPSSSGDADPDKISSDK